ncbi:MAG: FlgD immunoglobulin-like domain containing protein, partial [bacterium]
MIIHTEGWYGLVSVYGDDETTLEVDEGAEVGDTLTFYINGRLAHSTNGVEPIWVGDGEMVRVDLAASQLSSDIESRLRLPTEYGLSQNYPNPFNPTTTIRYAIPSREQRAESGGRGEGSALYALRSTLKIFNLLGQEVKRLVDEDKEPGYYTVTWDGRDSSGREVPTGVYFYRLRAGDYSSTKRMVLLK